MSLEDSGLIVIMHKVIIQIYKKIKIPVDKCRNKYVNFFSKIKEVYIDLRIKANFMLSKAAKY